MGSVCRMENDMPTVKVYPLPTLVNVGGTAIN
jgi:hypothetical protein